MRAFIVLCLVAVACADKLGYNYSPVGHSPSGLSFTPGSSGSSFGGSGAGSSFGVSGVGSSFGGSGSGSSFGGLGAGSSFGGSGAGSSFGGSGAGSFGAQGGLEKEFYTFSANDDDFNEPAASNQYGSAAKQNLRVIFIKGPENNGLENAVLGLAKQASEQKTAIYVLNKQTDLSGLAERLNTASSNVNNKPEVHFVKYRTAEDAINAQRAIQGQYDSLGGSSQSYNGGVAPVLNFASQGSSSHGAGSFGAGSHGVGSFGSGSHGSFGTHGSGSFGSGSFGSGSHGSFGAGSGLNPNYLPSAFRRYRLK